LKIFSRFAAGHFSAGSLVQFVKFGGVGFFNTLISYAVYSALVYAGLYYIFSNVIAFMAGIINSFFWNNKYVFKDTGKRRSVLKSFVKTLISYGFTGLILTNLLLFVLVDLLRASKYIAPFFCLLITVPLNFALNKFWAFKPRPSAGNTPVIKNSSPEETGVVQ
jgi:putative flippase GtrA